MANLLASINYDHHNRYIHRLGHKHISTSAETWHGSVRVRLDKDGNAVVRVGPKSGGGKVVWQGNIDEREEAV